METVIIDCLKSQTHSANDELRNLASLSDTMLMVIALLNNLRLESIEPRRVGQAIGVVVLAVFPSDTTQRIQLTTQATQQRLSP